MGYFRFFTSTGLVVSFSAMLIVITVVISWNQIRDPWSLAARGLPHMLDGVSFSVLPCLPAMRATLVCRADDCRSQASRPYVCVFVCLCVCAFV